MRDSLLMMAEYNRWADERSLIAISQMSDDQYRRSFAGQVSVKAVVGVMAQEARTWSARLEDGVVAMVPDDTETLTLDGARRDLTCLMRLVDQQPPATDVLTWLATIS
jgi:uncharacterized damage-inducible protein DinB